MKKLLLLAILVVSITSCTKQEMAKSFGGTATINLPAGQKLINVTWKETQIWYLTRPMRSDETPETYQFCEDSNYNIMEGKVILVETR